MSKRRSASGRSRRERKGASRREPGKADVGSAASDVRPGETDGDRIADNPLLGSVAPNVLRVEFRPTIIALPLTEGCGTREEELGDELSRMSPGPDPTGGSHRVWPARREVGTHEKPDVFGWSLAAEDKEMVAHPSGWMRSRFAGVARDRLAEALRQAVDELDDPTPASDAAIQESVLPFPGASALGGKVVAIDFRSSSSPSVVTQLPQAAPVVAKPAGRTGAERDSAERSSKNSMMVKGAARTVFHDFHDTEAPHRGSTGISTAWNGVHMEPPARIGQSDCPAQTAESSAIDAVPSQTGSSFQESRDTQGQGGSTAGGAIDNADATAMVDNLTNLVVHEALLARQHASDLMAVMLRPDDRTELFLHLSHSDGQMEASIRCERGDVARLEALWPRLRESLAQQKVRLTALRGAVPSAPSFRNPGGAAGPMDDRDSSARLLNPEQEFMDEWPAPASSTNGPTQVRSRQGSERRHTTSRPGWETWA